MVQQLFSEIERLKAEVARLRGRVDSFSAGGNIIPSNITFNPTQSNNAQSVIQNFINNSGGNLVDGDVVILDQTGERLITTTTTPQDITVLGVVRDFRSLGPFINAAETPVLLLGNMTLMKVNGAVAAGDYLVTTNSATRAKSIGADETQPGIFAIAETANVSGNGTVTALVFPVNYGAGSGLPTGGATGQALAKDSAADGDASWHDIEFLSTAETDTTKVLGVDGTGGVQFVTIGAVGGAVTAVRSYISFGTNMSGQTYTP